MVDLVVLACVLRVTTKKSFTVLPCSPPPKYLSLEPPLCVSKTSYYFSSYSYRCSPTPADFDTFDLIFNTARRSASDCIYTF